MNPIQPVKATLSQLDFGRLSKNGGAIHTNCRILLKMWYDFEICIFIKAFNPFSYVIDVKHLLSEPDNKPHGYAR